MIAAQLPPHSPPLLRISCDRYHEMIASGGLREDDRIELINGFLVTKMSIGSIHSAMVNRLNRLLSRLLGDSTIITVQNPITIHEYSEPEPDIVVARFREDFYAERHPYPQDILLVIEVADTSLAFDRDAKIPLYASCGIPESWLVDLNNHEIHVFRRPDGAAYQETHVFRAGDLIPVPGGSEGLAVTTLGL
ncbi:MAG: Uma2 family endonuclease [Verrucomicrobiaceae bacterium]|nr:Uma2 family endonuclease [Verrucomicrobiaceae bacterium]